MPAGLAPAAIQRLPGAPCALCRRLRFQLVIEYFNANRTSIPGSLQATDYAGHINDAVARQQPLVARLVAQRLIILRRLFSHIAQLDFIDTAGRDAL